MSEAFALGLGAALGTHVIPSEWSLGHPYFASRPEQLAVLLVCLLCIAGAARVATSPRAGALEAAAVLFLAHLPLALVQLASLHPDVVLPASSADAWPTYYDRAPLHDGFLVAEAASVASLVAGAAGLTRPRVAWTRVLAAPLAIAVGVGLGGWLWPPGGWVVGGPIGAAAVVFVFTARGVRGPASEASRAARVLAVLALAMAVTMASQLEWHDGPGHLHFVSPHAEEAADIVYAHRLLGVRLAGCAVALLFALGAGRPSRASSSSAMLAMLGAVCLIGGAAHLRYQRVAVFNWQWAHQKELGPHLLCGCSSWTERLPTRGQPHPVRSLPWPLTGPLNGPTPLSVFRIDVELEARPRPPGGLERLRALPTVTLDDLGLARPEDASAPEQQLRVPDGVPYGKVLQSLDRAIDVYETHLHILLEVPPDDSPP